jgi:hypothetical protein
LSKTGDPDEPESLHVACVQLQEVDTPSAVASDDVLAVR